MAVVLSLDDDELIVIRNEVKTVSLAPFSGTWVAKDDKQGLIN